MKQRKVIVLIDGSAVFHRGYHAIPPLSTRDGQPTNAVLGFANIILKVLNELKPTYAVVAWDKSSQTFRKDKYPAYKATRSKQPEDLYAQIPTTHELVEALNLPWVELHNYEADDIIGTLARQAEAAGLDVVIATGDRDQLQLISQYTVVDMFNPRGMEPTRYDLAKMQDKYSLTPTQFIDYKALLGDTSDNIPGVAGIGDVGARKLMAAYGSLDQIYAHIDEVVGALQAKLRQGKDMAYLSQDLSRIVCDAPVTLDLEASRVGHIDRERVTDLFHRLEFRSLLAKLPADPRQATSSSPSASNSTPPASVSPPTLFDVDKATPVPSTRPTRAHLTTANYRAITTTKALGELLEQLKRQKIFAIDTETTSLDISEVKLVGLSIAFAVGEAYYIPVGHTRPGAEATQQQQLADGQLSQAEVLQALKPVLEDAAIGKVGHNIKYDYEVLRTCEVTVAPIAMDTMVAAFLLNSAGRSQSLDDLAYSELGIEMIPITELIGSGKERVTFDQVEVEAATTYAAEDADISWRLYHLLAPRLDAAGLTKLAQAMEWPLIPVLGEMELAGIELDVPQLQAFGKRLATEIATLKTQIYDLAGEEFNLGSPSQMGNILYGRLGLSTVGLKKGKTGFSTAAGELEKLRASHPVVALIMKYREYDKLNNTYVKALPSLVKADGRIHTSFNQTIAQTGRLSSTNPNLQNIPVRTELGREIREAFVAPPGRVLISADYSQIELRVAAALAGDLEMIQTFRDGIDLHAATAAVLYDVPLAQVTKEQRYATKAINFGILYGMSAHGLSVATGMDQKQASEFITRYFEIRPKLKQYIEATKRFAYDELYTATLFGRRRPCPEIRSNNFQIRNGAERMAINVPIQGTAADIYKLSMIALAEKLDDGCKLLLQIHDELIVETPVERSNEIAAVMKEVMENVYDLGVPLAVDTAIGTNWGVL